MSKSLKKKLSRNSPGTEIRPLNFALFDVASRGQILFEKKPNRARIRVRIYAVSRFLRSNWLAAFVSIKLWQPQARSGRRDARVAAQVSTSVRRCIPAFPLPPPLSREPPVTVAFLLHTANEILYRDNGRIMSTASSTRRSSGGNPRISVPILERIKC